MTKSPPTRARDIVVIGCSAGGVDALPRLVHQLPHDFDAAVLIVQHMSPSHDPHLVDILRRSAVLPVSWAEQGERIVPGNIYVAPPDVHLVFADDHVALTRGARENYSRPSIDKLFRSAAVIHGNRTIGVLLTGMLDDGVAGLKAIRDAGGFAIVQDPDDAAFPDLPMRALAVSPDRVLPLDSIPSAMIAATRQPALARLLPETLALEAALDERGVGTPAELEKLGPQSAISCPECGGPTWHIGGEADRRYRCYLGHAISARELLARGTIEIESALWSAVRALSERAMTLETLATDAKRAGHVQVSERYATRAKEARTQADLARQFMHDLMRPQIH